MPDAYNPTDLRFEGFPVFLSNAAYRKALFLGMALYDIVAILEEGIEKPGMRRKPGVVEKFATFRRAWVKVVAVRDFHFSTNEECWLVVHVDTTDEP